LRSCRDGRSVEELDEEATDPTFEGEGRVAAGKECSAVNEGVGECRCEERSGLIVMSLNLSAISLIDSVGLLEWAWESSAMAPSDNVVTKSSRLASPTACSMFA
jgi:hypothetical protein